MASNMVAPRSFHFIEVDEARGILKKTNQIGNDILREINYYQSLPHELQYLFPRIISTSSESELPSVEIEYYGYPTLHRFFMDYDSSSVLDAGSAMDSTINADNFDEEIFAGTENVFDSDAEIEIEVESRFSIWRKIFSRIKSAVDDMKRFIPEATVEEFEEAAREIYIKKVLTRFERIKSDPTIAEPIKNRVAKIMEKLPNVVEEILIPETAENFHVIHGDLCLPNIMMERELNFIRLIDPRGEFGKFKIYGDGRYDLAKILHSIEGGYDFIIEDRFIARRRGDQIILKLDSAFEDKTHEIVRIFAEVFDLDANQMRQIRLIESTLFLSMVPLHSDAPKRQLAMLARGIELFERVEKF